MPSETRAPMDLQLQADRTFEVLLYTLPGTRFGLEERWFVVGPFAERLDALAEYEMLCREFREDALVVLVLVAVVLHEETGLYRDRILAARGRAPLIRRERMATLSAQERRRLIAATAPLRRMARRPAPPPPKSGGTPLLAIIGWGAVALVAALATWALAIGWFR
jgi:hypothetical protein